MRQLLLNGYAVPLGARAFDLLLCLIAHRERTVSRDELMKQVWCGINVGANNLNVQVSVLRKLLGARAVVTLPGQGLRFGLELQDHSPESAETVLALPAKPSVAVLPFNDMGVNPALSWLPDSIVEDITTELSRFRNLFVVARNSAFSFRDQAMNIRQVSRQLGVRYVVEGSVRTAPGRVRVTAQLIDALNGGHVWAENFDGPLDQHFDLQARIVRAIVTALAPQIDAAENIHIRTVQPSDLSAHGWAQKAWSGISAGEMKYDPAPRNQAQALAEKALAIDPNSCLAWRAIGWIQWWHAYHGTTDSRPDTLKAGVEAARRAMELDGNDHHAWRINALLDFMNQKPEQGLAGLRQAHEINPNCATSLAWLGMYEATHGDVAKGVPCVQAALRLSPRDPARGSFLAALGFAQFASTDYAAGARTADAARLEAPDSATPLLLGAICSVGIGQIDKARTLFTKLQGIAPRLTEERLNGRWLSTNQNYLNKAQTFLNIAAGLTDASVLDAGR